MEYCNSVKSIKCICKYVPKASHMAVFSIKTSNTNEEISHYQIGRYASYNENEDDVVPDQLDMRSTDALGRIYTVHPKNDGCFYSQLLLVIVLCAQADATSTGTRRYADLLRVSRSRVLRRGSCGPGVLRALVFRVGYEKRCNTFAHSEIYVSPLSESVPKERATPGVRSFRATEPRPFGLRPRSPDVFDSAGRRLENYVAIFKSNTPQSLSNRQPKINPQLYTYGRTVCPRLALDVDEFRRGPEFGTHLCSQLVLMKIVGHRLKCQHPRTSRNRMGRTKGVGVSQMSRGEESLRQLARIVTEKVKAGNLRSIHRAPTRVILVPSKLEFAGLGGEEGRGDRRRRQFKS
ncbi:hypothetical protein EVAR_95921_1 [Eumeta japonica]|uniref:Uncharacterized protein n=1 Tax=Eumeta variegata TaxID=151549 RepID=A0A4C1XGF2_EUMVA|nr:hypothetical protein EVAR_95921_1 [Eumeta japonica]